MTGIVGTRGIWVQRSLAAAARAGAWFSSLSLGLAASQYTIVDLGDFGGGFSRAWAVNDFGQAAGEAALPVAQDPFRAALWQSGTILDLGTLGGPRSAAFAINNNGTVGGWAQTASGNRLPTLWNGNTPTTLPTLGGTSSITISTVWGLNDAGVAVGQAHLGSGVHHATLWSGGVASDLGTLGGSFSTAWDINNGGTVVGTAHDAQGRDRAALWNGSVAVDLGGLSGGNWTAARAINDLGHVIFFGTPMGGSENRAAFWNGNPLSPVIELGTFGGVQSWAYGLNNFGSVVGWAENADATYHAFVWDGVEKTDLGTLEGGFYSAALGINDQGVIVGWSTVGSETRAVAWMPVPEPSAFLLGALAFGLTALQTFHRKRSLARRR